MKYLDALKKVQIKKTRDNYIVVEFGYYIKIVLPYKEGIAVLNCLGDAEILKDDYGKGKKILPFDRDAMTVCMMPPIEYDRIKVAALLGVSPDEVMQLEAETT